MSVPDLRSVLERVYREGGHSLTTKESAGRFTEAAALALHAVDSNFGHLRKPAGRTHVIGPDGNRHAVDVVLYRASGQIVDIIRDAGEPGAGLSWGVGAEHEYGEGDWYSPMAQGPTPEPPPTPPTVPPVDDSVLAALRHLGERLEAQARQLADVGEDVGKLLRRPAPTAPTYAGIASGPNPLPFGPRTLNLSVELVPKVVQDTTIPQSPPPPSADTDPGRLIHEASGWLRR